MSNTSSSNNPESFNVFLSKKERIKTLYQTNEFADCVFIIDGKEIKAHKLILTLSSPVFEKMFYGNLASNRIEITDIAVEDFQQMLEFVYNDYVRINSVMKAWDLFYIAQKYIMNDLADVCTTYIEKNLNIGNLVLNYEYADMYGILQLQAKCIQDIADYIRGIFLVNCDYHMKPTTLAVILSQHGLIIDNNELVKSVLNWAVIECDIKKISPSKETIIDLLQKLDLLKYLINLDFKCESSSELISSSMEMIKNLKDPKAEYRNYFVKHWCTICKSRQIYKIARREEIRPLECLFSQVSVNQNVLLFGIVVISEDEPVGSTSNEYKGQIKLEISEVNEPFIPVQITTVCRNFPYLAPVYIPLQEPTLLDCHKTYFIKVFYTNLNNCDGGYVCRNSSVLCQYMSTKLIDEKKKTIFIFDEINGSVIKGLCYYPA